MTRVMSLWGKLTGKLSRDEFVAHVLAAVRATDGDAELDAEGFAIKSRRQTLYLQNAWLEYERAPGRAERRNVIEAFAAGLGDFERAEDLDWDGARPLLRPIVRERVYFAFTELRLRAEGHTPPRALVRPLGAHLMVAVAVDLPRSIATVSDPLLERWKVGFDEALDTATKNLGHASHARWPEVAPGVRAAPFDDYYAASRIVLPQIMSRLEVRGRPVALVMERNLLFVTGADDERGLVALAALGEKTMAEPRAMSPFPVRLEDDGWVPHELPASHPAHAAFTKLHRGGVARNYEEQKPLLQQALGEDVFVASQMFLRRAGAHVSSASMMLDVPALLPVTDELAVGRKRDGELELLAFVPWAAAVEAADLRLEPECYPERWRFAGALSEAQIAALRRADLGMPDKA
jgi:hypothetical protein